MNTKRSPQPFRLGMTVPVLAVALVAFGLTWGAVPAAAGDRFVTNGFTHTSPAVALAACAPTTIGAVVFPGRGPHLLSLNQDWYQEVPSIRPNVLTWLKAQAK